MFTKPNVVSLDDVPSTSANDGKRPIGSKFQFGAGTSFLLKATKEKADAAPADAVPVSRKDAHKKVLLWPHAQPVDFETPRLVMSSLDVSAMDMEDTIAIVW